MIQREISVLQFYPRKDSFLAVQMLRIFSVFSIFSRLSVNIENLPPKRKFRKSSYSVSKNPLLKHFRKSQSKFPKIFFIIRENRQKVKCCPTPYSRRSKTFELYHFQSPREERRFKETSSSLAGK